MIKYVNRFVIFVGWLTTFALQAVAGELSRSQIEARLKMPYHLQEKLSDLQAWPFISDLSPGDGPAGYIFESIDIAPLPGFSGTPLNLLVMIDRNGNFLNVEILNQHEPILVGVLGEEPLREFVQQYIGNNLKSEFTISTGQKNSQSQIGNQRIVLDGITRATTSVRIVNQTVLASALSVARAKLGFSEAKKNTPAYPRQDVFERLSFNQLLARGMIARLHLSNDQVESLFKDDDAAGSDKIGLANPQHTNVDLYAAYLNAPTIGRSLLGDASYSALMESLEIGQQVLWIGTAGRYSMLDDGFVPASVPQRLSLTQNGLPLELRDLVINLSKFGDGPELNASRVFSIYAAAGLDPASSMEISLMLSRTTTKGQILPRTFQKFVTLQYNPPKRLFAYPPRQFPEWFLAWKSRWIDLSLIGAALFSLSLLLIRPQRVCRDKKIWAIVRLSFLTFTLFYIGFYAQGQLSIVQLIGLAKSLGNLHGLGSILYDPVSLLIIAFTVITLLVWGRGTFCGWLCPFGAFQEIIGAIAKKTRIPQIKLAKYPIARHLEKTRFILLAILILISVGMPDLFELFSEIEPFKTSITVAFDRSWPYVTYALLVLFLGAFYLKFFCRFICPLGAALSFGGKIRLFSWIPRRIECGSPCQTCRSRCAYDAIEKSGAIKYDDCFQCMECVGIYNDKERCAPILLFHKNGLVMTPAGIKNKNIEKPVFIVRSN